MVDLTKFTSTKKADFEQLARDRKKDFDALQRQKRWTASVYIGPYIVEAWLKSKICERLNFETLPAVFKTHDLIVLAMYAGLMKSIKATPGVFENLAVINTFHRDSTWRYKVADQSHQTDSNKMRDWLFHSQHGVMTWLER